MAPANQLRLSFVGSEDGEAETGGRSPYADYSIRRFSITICE